MCSLVNLRKVKAGKTRMLFYFEGFFKSCQIAELIHLLMFVSSLST